MNITAQFAKFKIIRVKIISKIDDKITFSSPNNHSIIR